MKHEQAKKLTEMCIQYVGLRLDGKGDKAEEFIDKLPKDMHSIIIRVGMSLIAEGQNDGLKPLIFACLESLDLNNCPPKILRALFDSIAYDMFQKFIRGRKSKSTFIIDCLESNDPELQEVAKQMQEIC